MRRATADEEKAEREGTGEEGRARTKRKAGVEQDGGREKTGRRARKEEEMKGNVRKKEAEDNEEERDSGKGWGPHWPDPPGRLGKPSADRNARARAKFAAHGFPTPPPPAPCVSTATRNV